MLTFLEPHKEWHGSRLMNKVPYVTLHLSMLALFGVDVLATALISFGVSRPLTKLGETRYQLWGCGKLLTNVVLIPALWVAAMADVFQEQTGGEGTADLFGHAVIPILLAARSQFMWVSLMKFCKALKAANGVVSLLVCLIIVAASFSPVLLRDMYQTGDFYTDNQFQSFIVSFTSMFIYMLTGANYVEALDEPLNANYWKMAFHSIFFIGFLVVGFFFIAAVLIEIFQSSFLEGGGESTGRRQKLAAGVVLYYIWPRHCEWCESSMTVDVFMDCLLQQGRLWPQLHTDENLEWLNSLHFQLTNEVMNFLAVDSSNVDELRHVAVMIPGERERRRGALLDVCAQVRAIKLYGLLLDDWEKEGVTDYGAGERPSLLVREHAFWTLL